jgi:hypothetical protein
LIIKEGTMPVSKCISLLRVALLGIAGAALVTLAACGGGGDGDSSGTSDSTAPATGKVAILLTDGATDEFCQILATVESIDLLGESGSRTNVFTGPETVDILAIATTPISSPSIPRCRSAPMRRCA